MDIKSRNIKYSWGAKAIAVILVWLSFTSLMGSGLLAIENSRAASSGNYYDVPAFKYEFANLVYNVVKAEVVLKSEENIRALNGDDRIKESNVEYFHSIKNNIAGSVNFKYYIKNTVSRETITNITAQDPEEYFRKQPDYIFLGRSQSKYNLPIYKAEIEEVLRNTGYEVYAAVQQPLKPGDSFYDYYMNFIRAKSVIAYAYPIMAISAVVLITAAAYLAFAAGLREKGGAVVLLPIDGLYSDVHTLLVILAALLSVTVSIGGFGGELESWIIYIFVLTIDAFIGISYCMSMIRQIKCGMLLKNTLAAVLWKKSGRFLTYCFSGQMFRPSLMLLLLGYGAVNGILFDLGVDLREGFQMPVFTVLLLAFNTVAIYFSGKALYSLSHIVTAAREISSGNTGFVLNSDISVIFKGLAGDIENIQGGLQRAVAEAVRGERMKTELITNVSHDLKTPLTSIVNYVDLLKKEDLNSQKAEEYVTILEEKAGRLKQLIEDLVEASKASSGNLTVNAEKVDLHELVMQACGEYEEKFKSAELDIRINSAEKNTYIYADGKHMWRIIENLLSNVIKYSMPKSRVYLSIEKSGGFGLLTIKNMASYPLDIPAEQLTERFVRGDESRTTEGSGLGLSIAQSLAMLQGGRFKIGIDGDLFKVRVEIPLFTGDEGSMV